MILKFAFKKRTECGFLSIFWLLVFPQLQIDKPEKVDVLRGIYVFNMTLRILPIFSSSTKADIWTLASFTQWLEC